MGRGGAASWLSTWIRHFTQMLPGATGEWRQRLLEVLGTFRGELEQVARRSMGRMQLTAPVANLVPALSQSVVRLPTASPRVAAVGGGGNTMNVNVSAPAGAAPDGRYLVAQLDSELRNRGWAG